MTEYLGVSPAFLIRKGMYTARKCTSIVRKRHNSKSSIRQLLRFSLIDQAASLSISSVVRKAEEDEFSRILVRSGDFKERSVIVEREEWENDV